MTGATVSGGRPLLDLRNPENAETLHARDVRASLGRDTCRVLDLVASEPTRHWSSGHVGQQTRMVKATAASTLVTLGRLGLAERARDRWRITDLGQEIAMPR